MKVILALICFITVILHCIFGYYLYNQGENIFYPAQAVEEFQEKLRAASTPVVKDVEVTPATGEKPMSIALVVEGKPEAEAPAETSETPSEASEQKPVVSEESKSEESKPIPSVLKHLVPKDKETVESQQPEIKQSMAISPLLQAPNPPVKSPEFDTGWSGFLQTQNAIIGILPLFLGLAVCFVKGRGSASRWVFLVNFLFWGTYAVATWFYHPVNTMFIIAKIKLNFPEWYSLFGLTAIAAVDSFILYFNAFRSVEGLNKKKKKVEPEPELEPEPEPEVKPKKRGFFHRRAEEPVVTSPAETLSEPKLSVSESTETVSGETENN